MKKTIDKYSIHITLWSAISVIIFVIYWVLTISNAEAWLNQKISLNSTEIKILNERSETQRKYLYGLKSDLKSEIERNADKLDKIYQIIIRLK